MKTPPRFFRAGSRIIAFAHVVAVDLQDDGGATVQLSSGNSYTFDGQTAAAVALAFANLDRAESEAAHEPTGAADIPLAK